MLTNFKELIDARGASLCDPVGFGKYKGKRLWEIPETYWQSLCTKNHLPYASLLEKISEARTHRDIQSTRPQRRKIDVANIGSPRLVEQGKQFFPHQREYVLTFGNDSYSNLWAAIGTGKTFAYLEVVRQKIRMDDKILIICPKAVFSSWNNAISDYLGPKATYINVTGSTDEKIQRLSYSRYFYITNYETLLNERILSVLIDKGFTFIVADEAHKRLVNTASRTYKAAMALSANIENKNTLTGTPRRKDETNLYGLITFLDRGERFGPSFYKFKEKYFDKGWNGFDLSLKENMEKDFWDKVKSCSFVVPKEILKLPKLDKIIKDVELTGDTKKYYEIMYKEAMIEIERYDQDRTNKVIASVAIAKITKLRQICSGFVNGFSYGDDLSDEENGKKETVVFNQDKLEELTEILEEIDEPVIITAIYKEEIKQIEGLLQKLGLKFGTIAGKTKDKDRETSRLAFSENRLDAIIIQEQAGGAGIDGLQNHCSLMVRYSYGYSFDDDDQVIGRMERQGQKKEMRMIRLKTVLPAEKGKEPKPTIEEAIIQSIESKSEGFDNLVNILKGTR